MASNKNQHFVPRCYLRPFTIDEAGVVLNLYNVDRDKVIPKVPVKSQCSRDYFYGTDQKLEDAIQFLEGSYATALRNIVEPNYKLSDEHRLLLKRFWLFQNLRTEAASRRAVEMSEGARVTAGVEDESYTMQIKDAVQLAMHTFAENMDIVSDLKACLFWNRTEVPFVTSDDPAVLTNRWYLQSRKTRGMSFGLSAAGNIGLLPITPKILLVAYDGDVYSIPHQGGWVAVKDKQDVMALNEHQFLNCRANIFFKNQDHGVLIKNAFPKLQPLRPEASHRIHYAVRDCEEDGLVRYKVIDRENAGAHEDAVIHIQSVHPAPVSWPRQILWRKKGKVFTNGTGSGFVRRNYAFPEDAPRHWQETPTL